MEGHELDRIELALQTRQLDPRTFERCVQDLLVTVYPGISPIPGGSDSGRDADARVEPGREPLRVLITSARTVDGVRANMIKGIRSMRAHGVAVDRIVLANAAVLNEHARQGLSGSARKHGVSVYAFFDATYFASRLRRDGGWRRKLLDLPGHPASVARVPVKIAESPWGRLPLRGRETELAQLRNLDSDVLLVGPPGAGKTRLLVELDDVLFVERETDMERLADDLRALQPSRVVIDDAAESLDMLRFVLRLRRSERDLLDFAVVATCWPHEADEVAEAIPGATRLDLPDLERTHIDAVIVSMGVTGIAARHTVVEQAEGRVGWALTLTELLLGADFAEVVSGRALLRQMAPFFRRMGFGDDARRIAAVVAAAGGVRGEEVARLASTVGLTESAARSWLKQIVRSGLMEVVPEPHGTAPQAWVVRPIMLGQALATDVLFAEDGSLIGVARLLEMWPDRRGELTRAVCVAAAAGAAGARAQADQLVAETLAGPSTAGVRSDFLGIYTGLDQAAARSVLAAISVDRQRPVTQQKFLTVEVVQVARVAVDRHKERQAVALLLDLAVEVEEITVRGPTRPMKVLTDLCDRSVPDRPIDATLRYLIADVVTDWLPQEPTEQQWQVWGVVTAAILNPHVTGAYLDPGDHEQIGLLDGLLAVPDLHLLHSRVWPRLIARMGAAPDGSVRAVLSAVEEWVRIGRGLDHPYGRDHPSEQINACLGEGTAMLDSLSGTLSDGPGWSRRLARSYRQFDLAPPSHLPTDDDPFFRNIAGSIDLNSAEKAVSDDIADAVRGWSDHPPQEVTARLMRIRTETAAAGPGWPNRIEIACQHIAATSDGATREWVKAALCHGLFPDAALFIETWARTERITTNDPLVRELLDSRDARPIALAALLTGEDATTVVDLIADTDIRVLTVLAVRGGIPVPAEQRILERAPTRARSVYALHMVARQPSPFREPDGVRVETWAGAVGAAHLDDLEPEDVHRLGQAIDLLETASPHLLRQLLPDLIGRASIIHLGRHLMLGLASVIARLPRDLRTAIICTRPAGHDRATLVGALVGMDLEWITALLDDRDIEPDDAIAAASRTAPVDTAAWARILVPRGVLPEEVAALARRGVFSGSRAEHLQHLVEQMSEMTQHSDPVVVAVGEAGVALFAREHAAAEATEHHQRIRR